MHMMLDLPPVNMSVLYAFEFGFERGRVEYASTYVVATEIGYRGANLS